MKVLISVIPGKSHLMIVLPLARQLKQRGHEILFVSGASFCPLIEAQGFHTMPVGFDWLKVSPENLTAGGNPLLLQRALQGTSSLQQASQSMAEPSTNAQPVVTEALIDANVNLPVVAALEIDNLLPGFLEVLKTWQPDVILRDPLDFVSYIAADITAIPHASFGTMVLWPKAWLEYMAGSHIAGARERHGLAPDANLERLDHYLTLSFTPRGYQFTSGNIQTLHFVKPAVEDTIGKAILPEWLGTLPDQPTIYISMGTMMRQSEEVYRTILLSLRDEPLNIVVALGDTLDPAIFGQQPANVRIESYIPFSLFAPYCQAVISHAGVNTILTALSHGLPMLVIPLGADQPLHAMRCTDLDVALRLDVGDLRPQEIREAVQSLLNEPRYRRAAQPFQREIADMPGPDYAARLIEQLARDRQPIAGEVFGEQ